MIEDYRRCATITLLAAVTFDGATPPSARPGERGTAADRSRRLCQAARALILAKLTAAEDSGHLTASASRPTLSPALRAKY